MEPVCNPKGCCPKDHSFQEFPASGHNKPNIFHFAQEHELNLALGGHYRTEPLGIRALQELIDWEFQVETTFIDLPTDL